MAIFSNLEGTMQNSFIIGKNGAQLLSRGTDVRVINYQGTKLLPIAAADPDPMNNTHLVTLGYLNSHSGGGGNILRGTTAPSVAMGQDGDVYFQIDATNTTQIYIKDNGIWKPFVGSGPITDSDYVTTFDVPVSDFLLKPGTTDVYEYIIDAETHQRGSDILVQLEGEPGGAIISADVINATVIVSGLGDITITTVGLPTEYNIIKVNLIGATTMTAPYGQLINQADWLAVGDKFQLVISATTHKQSQDSLFISMYANDVPGSTASSPFNLVTVDTTIDSAGNVTFMADSSFSGKTVIAGK